MRLHPLACFDLFALSMELFYLAATQDCSRGFYLATLRLALLGLTSSLKWFLCVVRGAFYHGVDNVIVFKIDCVVVIGPAANRG